VTLPTLTLRSVLRCILMSLTFLAISASAHIAPVPNANTSAASPTTNYGSATTPNVVSPPQTRIPFKKGNCNDNAN
jgi:hypothetical protein